MASQLREQMKLENVDPDRATFSYMINMYSRKGLYKEILNTFEQMRSSTLVPDRNVCHIILTAYSKLGASCFHFLPFEFSLAGFKDKVELCITLVRLILTYDCSQYP